MLFNGRALIFTFSGTQVRIAEIERLQSLDVYGAVIAVVALAIYLLLLSLVDYTDRSPTSLIHWTADGI